jgi:hypothetical protein
MNIFVSCVNAHQSVASAEEDFSNQLTMKSPSVDISHSLFPTTLVISQWAHEQGGHDGSMEIIYYLYLLPILPVQGLAHARKALYHLSDSTSPRMGFSSMYSWSRLTWSLMLLNTQSASSRD